MSEMRKATAGNGGAIGGEPSNPNSTATHDSVLAAAAGYAVLVETGEGRYRRRLFLTLAAAERAVRRARERGQYAELILVRVVPVGVVA